MKLNEKSEFLCIHELECIACRDYVQKLQMVNRKSEAWRWLTPSHVWNSKFGMALVLICICHSIFHWVVWKRHLRHNGPCVALIRRCNQFLACLSLTFVGVSSFLYPNYVKLMSSYRCRKSSPPSITRIEKFPYKIHVTCPRQWNTIL